MKKIEILFLFFLFSYNLSAQEWVSQYQAAQSAYANSNYTQAFELGKKSLSGFLEADGSLNNNYASILRLLTTICYEADFVNEGINYAEKEVKVRETMGETESLEFATSLYNLGALYQLDQAPEKALETFKKATDIYQQFYQPNNENVINCKWKIASSLVSLGENDKAFTIFEETMGLVDQQEGVTMDYVNACTDYTNLLVDKKQYEPALPYLNDLENIYTSLGEGFEQMLAQVYMNKGICLHHTNRYQEAENAYLQASEIYKTTDSDSNVQVQLKNLMAINYQSMGETTKADELLAAVSAEGSESNQASALNNQAMLKQQAGDYKEAKQLLLAAIEKLEVAASDSLALAETMDNLSTLYLIQGKADSAKAVASQALSIKQSIGSLPVNIATSYTKLGEAHHALSQWQEAGSSYEKAEELLKDKPAGKNKYTSLLGHMAIYYQDKGDYNQAEKLFIEQSQRIAQEKGDNSMEYAIVLNNMATLKQIQAKYFEANNYLEQALQITEQAAGKNSLNYTSIAENQGLIAIQLGNLSEAEKLLNEVAVIRKEQLSTQHPLYANALQNLGRLKQNQGKYQEAEPLFDEALQIKKSTYGTNHPEYAHALNNMALLYQTMGNFTRAEQLFEEAVTINKKVYGEEHPEYATALENLATLKKIKGYDNKAIELLNEALAIDKKTLGQQHPRYATTLHNLASTYKDVGKYEQAAALFSEALAIDKNVYGENHTAYASTLYNLAVLQQELKQIDQAEKNFKRALEIREQLLGKNHPDYAYSLYGLAGLYHLTGAFEKAKPYYDEVISNYLRQIDDFFPSLSEKEKSAFYGKIKPVIESYQDFATEYATSNLDSAHQIIGDLYNLQLITKALLLHASNKVRNRIFNSGNQALIDNYEQWTQMKEQLSKYLSYSPEELEEQRIDLNALADEINDIEKFLSQQSETFANEIDKENISWQEIKKTLQPNEAAVEILRIKKRYIEDSIIYVGLIIKPDYTQPKMVILDEGNNLERRFFNYYRNAIKFTVGDEISFQKFWQPIDEQLTGVDKVFASSDGVFNKININTLYNPEAKKYVIDRYNVRSVSNTREILKPKKQIDQENNIAAVFGYPDFNLGVESTHAGTVSKTRASQFGFTDLIPELPGTKTEVKALDNILTEKGWQTKLYTQAQASEKEVKAVSNPKLLHIATHGFFMKDIDYTINTDYGMYFNDQDYNPLFRSGLLLAGAAGAIYKDQKLNDEDGILTAYEAMNLNLDKTSLVVLSACETGIGEVKNGEGVYGLQRALLVAGAESVIMSLWQVDDYTTQRLMVLFYKNWLSGQDKFEAFKNAEKKLKEEFDDPFHWGAFIILGIE